MLTPVIIGFGINYFALGAFLAAVILTGQLMANFLSNSGGAWDNAKKYIEDGHEGGKGSEAHKAAVIGDTVGDPFKDTAGPALNPLIKVMNLVSLLILPAVINLQDNDGARFAIAGVALVVLLGAIAFSKRSDRLDDGHALGCPPRPTVARQARRLSEFVLALSSAQSSGRAQLRAFGRRPLSLRAAVDACGGAATRSRRREQRQQ